MGNPCLNQAGILVSIARCSKIKFITCSLTISIIRSIRSITLVINRAITEKKQGSITVAFIRERMHDYDEAFKTEFREECESKDPKTQEEYQDKAFQDQRRFEFYKEQVTKSHVVPWSHLMLDASQAYIYWTHSPRSKNPATKARFVQMAEKTENNFYYEKTKIDVAMETEWTRSYLYFLWQIHRAGAKHIVWYAHIDKQFVCGPLYQAFEDIAPSKAAGVVEMRSCNTTTHEEDEDDEDDDRDEARKTAQNQCSQTFEAMAKTTVFKNECEKKGKLPEETMQPTSFINAVWEEYMKRATDEDSWTRFRKTLLIDEDENECGNPNNKYPK